MAKAKAALAAKEPAFSKAQFLESGRFETTEKDILDAILKPGKQYTLAEAKKMVSDFLKRKVK